MKIKLNTYRHGIIYQDIPKGDVFGEFAVTPALEEDSAGKVSSFGWDITHTPTGCSVLPKWSDGKSIGIVNKEDAHDLAQRFSKLPKNLIDRGRLGDEDALAIIKKVWKDWRFSGEGE